MFETYLKRRNNSEKSILILSLSKHSQDGGKNYVKIYLKKKQT